MKRTLHKILFTSILIALAQYSLLSSSTDAAEDIGDKVTENPETIETLRNKIDTIDHEILVLLNERAVAAAEIGKLKEKQGLNVYNPEREKIIEEKLKRDNPGPLTDSSVIKIFREIISACRSIQY